ncbi:hypothetical protein AB7M49_004233 [Bradyrhizobium elkanii]
MYSFGGPGEPLWGRHIRIPYQFERLRAALIAPNDKRDRRAVGPEAGVDQVKLNVSLERIEVERLKIPTTEHVLQTDVVNIDADERLISFGQTAYAASRVEFVFGG